MYHSYDFLRESLYPLQNTATIAKSLISEIDLNFSKNNCYINNLYPSIVDDIDRFSKKYNKPLFNIKSVEVDNSLYSVSENIIYSKPFCNLLHFEKIGYQNDSHQHPKLLIVAPMAGHYATLLRDTVKTMLRYCDVYITDWISASDVPAALGKFDMEDYISYLLDFFRFFNANIHVLAVCQPTVPVIAAISLMSEFQEEHTPKTMILVGGPVDARQNPTKVNEFAVSKDIDWFKKNCIHSVPHGYLGAGRKVYPGFLQLAGFMSMNLAHHINSHIEYTKNKLIGNYTKVAKYRKFYDEYLAVMDLSEEFYIQTIHNVFHNYSLATGRLIYKNHLIKPESIKNTALLVVEGENDDIASIGQTKAALDICSNCINKEYYIQPEVGHYGVFSGSRFRKYIALEISKFVHSNDK